MNHRKLVGVMCALAVLGSGCGGGEETEPPPSELTGLITRVDGHGSNVSAFVLDAEGESYEINVVSDVDYGFDLAHLREHERLAQPVRVRIEERGGALYALRIDDA
jgi:hypothetical protein